MHRSQLRHKTFKKTPGSQRPRRILSFTSAIYKLPQYKQESVRLWKLQSFRVEFQEHRLPWRHRQTSLGDAVNTICWSLGSHARSDRMRRTEWEQKEFRHRDCLKVRRLGNNAYVCFGMSIKEYLEMDFARFNKSHSTRRSDIKRLCKISSSDHTDNTCVVLNSNEGYAYFLFERK